MNGNSNKMSLWLKSWSINTKHFFLARELHSNLLQEILMMQANSFSACFAGTFMLTNAAPPHELDNN